MRTDVSVMMLPAMDGAHGAPYSMQDSKWQIWREYHQKHVRWTAYLLAFKKYTHPV
jgi:hypothetical protein